MPTHDGRVEAARDIAKLLEGGGDLAPCLTEAHSRIGIAIQALLEQAQLERQTDESLVSARANEEAAPAPHASAIAQSTDGLGGRRLEGTWEGAASARPLMSHAPF
jgi:hypothetical protein